MPSPLSLTNHLLIATPSVQNPDFMHSVIYVCEHHDQGSVGLIVNRPMKHSLGLVFDQLHILPTLKQRRRRYYLVGLCNLSEGLLFIAQSGIGNRVWLYYRTR